MRWLLIAAGLAGLAWLAAWMQRKGWVSIRGGSPGGGAGALGALQQVIEPQTRHVYQMKQEKPRPGADAGDR